MESVFVCPQPIVWNEIYQGLCQAHRERARQQAGIPEPPRPLILAGWVYSNDADKQACWQATVEWAAAYGFRHLIPELQPEQIYAVTNVSTYTVEPMGGPMYLEWNFRARRRPSEFEVRQALEILHERWPEITGDELGAITRPLRFTGRKLRRLLVEADGRASPPWGTWEVLASGEMRRNFTKFRQRVNDAIQPLMVDHIDFQLVDEWPRERGDLSTAA